MEFLKAEITRYIALGFGAGALLVLATIGIDGSANLGTGMVTPAVAAPAQ